ncbi:MAG: GNAT family N-acetyltransferase [Magnetococcales bacterium]|nr:GNAT family N-acetyltransferase [Magnetococcales bacterium]
MLKIKKTIIRLHKSHKKDLFDCGEPELNKYLKQYARQNSDNGIARAFVAVANDGSNRINGFYTLSSSHIGFKEVPPSMRKRIPRYPIPAIRIGRLAVDKSMQGQGLGSILLIDALYRSLRVANEIAVKLVIVDAKHQNAKEFYQHFGFIELVDKPLNLFLQIETIKNL